MTEQRDRLFAALTHVVQRLDDPELPAYLMALGRDHRKFAARPEHYAAVGESLIAALRVALPTTWDDETENAWLGAYKILSDAMISGAEEADRRNEPPWWECRVSSRVSRAPGVTTLTLLPDRALPFAAGQYVSVCAPAAQHVWRPYSIGCAPRRDGTFDLHVSRVDGGLLSPVLVDQVRRGDLLRVGPPTGNLVLPERPRRPVTFIAGGTGWATIRALVEDMLRRWPPHQARLFFAARSADHVYDADAIDALREHSPWLGVTVVTPPRGDRRAAAAARLKTALAAHGDWAAHDVYMAGPGDFITHVRSQLEDLGTPPDRIRHDHVPVPERSAREPGHAQRLLNPPRPQWINPAER